MKRKDRIEAALEPLFDDGIPDRWKEIEARVDAAAPVHMVPRRKRRYSAAIAAAACTVVAAAAVWGGYLAAGTRRPAVGDFSEGAAPSADGGLPSGTGREAAGLPPASVPEDDAGRLVIHELESGVAAMPLLIPDDEMYTEYWDIGQVLGYLGRDIRPTALPADMRQVGPDRGWSAEFYNDGTMIPYPCYNEFGFYYTGKEEEIPELTRRLRVDATRTNSRVGDMLYMFDEDMEPSVLAGVEMRIGHCRVGHYDGGKEPIGWYDRYVAQFTLDGLTMQMVSENLDEGEFLAAVRSVACAPQV